MDFQKNYYYSYSVAGNRTSEQIDNQVTAASHNLLNEVKTLAPTGPIRFEGSLNEPGTLTINGKTVPLNASNAFSSDVSLAPGVNTMTLVATDAANNSTTKHYQVTIADGQIRMPSYDLNGNMTDDDAGKTYDWDGADRLVKITQGANVTEFVYDGKGRRVQEKLNGSVIKQWVWDGTAMAEERDASNTVTKRFVGQGEQIGGTSYYFTTDHLGSVREMTDTTGAIRARYDYDPYGRMTKLSGDLEADFGFTGFYSHQSSGLWLTLYRTYDANLGRWLSRDPIGEGGGNNLYSYVGGNPVNAVDPLGLLPEITYTDRTTIVAQSGANFLQLLRKAKPHSITSIRFDGDFEEHGNSQDQIVAQPAFLPADHITIDEKTGKLILVIGFPESTTVLDSLLREKLADKANMIYTGCQTAKGDNSLAEKTSRILGKNISVTGNMTSSWGWFFKRWATFGGNPRTFVGGKPVGGP